VVLLNAAGHPVLIAQTGWGGVILGRIDIWFDQSFRRRQMQSRPLTLDH
jgi:hypothetical protein